MRDPYHPYDPPGWSIPSDLMMLIGRIDERTGTTADRVEETVDRLDRIDSRLEAGDKRMDAIDRKITNLEQSAQDVPGWEKVVKALAPYAILGGALAWTGSITDAVRLLGAVKGVLL